MAPRQLRGRGKSFAVVLFRTIVIGSVLCRPLLAGAFSDAPVATSIKISETSVMNEKKSSPVHRSVQTPSGRISYTEQGSGPVALFVHGVLLNGCLWRHQLEDLSDVRRCIAVDLLSHGDTEIAPDQDVSVTANAKMLKEFLDALHIDQVDLVGNDRSEEHTSELQSHHDLVCRLLLEKKKKKKKKKQETNKKRITKK